MKYIIRLQSVCKSPMLARPGHHLGFRLSVACMGYLCSPGLLAIGLTWWAIAVTVRCRQTFGCHRRMCTEFQRTAGAPFRCSITLVRDGGHGCHLTHFWRSVGRPIRPGQNDGDNMLSPDLPTPVVVDNLLTVRAMIAASSPFLARYHWRQTAVERSKPSNRSEMKSRP
ncbi:hypothetical protein ACLOJK_019460 [Asimina triloba]